MADSNDNIDRGIQFGTLQPDGTVTNQRTIKHSTIRSCPHLIMVADHYREDGTCKCDDPNEKVMVEWGYRWNEEQKQWSSSGPYSPEEYKMYLASEGYDALYQNEANPDEFVAVNGDTNERFYRRADGCAGWSLDTIDETGSLEFITSVDVSREGFKQIV